MNYEEILEWARKNKARLNGVPIEEVLPELTEREDERIRKEIVGVIQKHYPNTPESYRWIAWLEKQKENQYFAGYVKGYSEGQKNPHLKEPTTEELYAEQGTTEEEYIANTMKKVRELREKQKESLHIPETCKENPDSFTDEDERIRMAIIEHFKQSEIEFPGLTFGGYYYSDVLSYLEKQKEQKPADLSEMMVHKEPYIAPVPTPMVANEQKSKEPSGKLSRQDYLYQLLIDQLITYSDYEYLIGQKPAE